MMQSYVNDNLDLLQWILRIYHRYFSDENLFSFVQFGYFFYEILFSFSFLSISWVFFSVIQTKILVKCNYRSSSVD